MLSIGLVISIAVPILILLAIAVFLNKQQQKKLRQKSQTRAIKEFIAELAEALEFLVKVDDHKEIQELVFARIKDLNSRYVGFLPKKLRTGASAVDLDGLQKKLLAGGGREANIKE
jgi:hypothetical protein